VFFNWLQRAGGYVGGDHDRGDRVGPHGDILFLVRLIAQNAVTVKRRAHEFTGEIRDQSEASRGHLRHFHAGHFNGLAGHHMKFLTSPATCRPSFSNACDVRQVFPSRGGCANSVNAAKNTMGPMNFSMMERKVISGREITQASTHAPERWVLLRKETDGERVFKQVALGCLIATAQDEKNVNIRPGPQANARRHGKAVDFTQEDQDRKVKCHRELKIQHGAPMAIGAGRLIFSNDPDDEGSEDIRCRNKSGNQDQCREVAGGFPCVIFLLHGVDVTARCANGKLNVGHCNIDFSEKGRMKGGGG
jgi:hypothetical protein